MRFEQFVSFFFLITVSMDLSYGVTLRSFANYKLHECEVTKISVVRLLKLLAHHYLSIASANSPNRTEFDNSFIQYILYNYYLTAYFAGFNASSKICSICMYDNDS